MVKDELVRQAAFERHEEGAVRDAYETLREMPFIIDYGPRGVMLDNSTFGALADYLYGDCEWPAWETTTKLTHYEGWGTHEWA